MSKRNTTEKGPIVIQEISTSTINPDGGIIHPADLIGKGIGRFTAPMHQSSSWSSDPVFDRFHNLLNGLGDGKNSAERIRKRLAGDLNYNRIERLMAEKYHGRAVSAFYTIDDKNGKLIIEWGKIDPDTNEGKLHESLRRAVNYTARATAKMKLVSGHIAPVDATGKFFALLDSIDHTPEKPHSFSKPELSLIDTLHSQGFLPLTAQGRLLSTSLGLGYYI